MTVLVTGSTGLVGTALVKFFAAMPDCHVLAAARNVEKACALFGRLGDAVEVVEWDVSAPAAFAHGKVDYVVHAASETASRAFVERPVEVIRSIVDGTSNVLEFARAADVAGMVFLSTMEVYGVPSREVVTETDYGYLDPTALRSSYPEAKRLAESLCVAYAREYGVHVRIARLAQTFGEGVARGDRRVFAQFAEAAAAGRDVVLHTEGRTARCYCHVGDAVSAIWTLLRNGVDGEAYTVANPDTFCTIREMAEMVAAANPPCRVVVDRAAGAGRGYAPELRMRLSAKKLEALGWRPRVGLPEMFRRMAADWSKGASWRQEGNGQ